MNYPLAHVTHCYLGTKPCGCTIAFVIDDPKFAEETADSVAEFIKDGMTITRVPIADCNIRKCVHQ